MGETKTDSNFVSLETVIKSGQKLTPMMAQYSDVKKDYPDTIVFFRMGDFYELFFEDAVNASKLLNITLTHRGKIGDFKIPMAGIPHHAASAYVDRLSSMGLKVAIAEQVEDPKEAKGIVKRAVTQIVSPGMPFDLERSDVLSLYYMASFMKAGEGKRFYLCLMDYTTGEFKGYFLNSFEELKEKLKSYSPKEIILTKKQESYFEKGFLELVGSTLTTIPEDYFNIKHTKIYLEKVFASYKRDQILKKHSDLFNPLGALAYYVCSTQKLDNFYHIRPFQLISDDDFMKVTDGTLKGVEILPRSKESWNTSLLAHVNKTKTSIGLRCLKKWFLEPLKSIDRITGRQNSIKFFVENIEITENLRDELSTVRDIERILAKTTSGKVNATDFLNLSESIKAYERIENLLNSNKKYHREVPFLKKAEIKNLLELAVEIEKTINDEVGATLEKGNLIKSGCSKKRDKLKKLLDNSTEAILELERKYRTSTEISNLRIKHNNVFGYFIEISKVQAKNAPEEFQRKQTLVNCERFMTEELSELEKELTTAKEKLQKLEREIYKSLLEKVVNFGIPLGNLSRFLGVIDTLQSFAWVSYKEDFVLPQFTDTPQTLEIDKGWHPLIKRTLDESFVPHDLKLSSDKFFGLITGPNMAGKTTVMREMAIIQFLGQLGSFVPAKKAKLSVCDFLFSRLGASDDIVNGQSTFMVEMSETASILRHATKNSFIILDEVGRGTSTYDGLSIAWALVEKFVNETKALCLFSTHYHELIELVDGLNGAQNLTVETINFEGDVKFLYRLLEQGAQQSYGIHVAKLAGLESSILNRAKEILKSLENIDNQTKDLAEKSFPAINSSSDKEINNENQLSIFDFSSPNQMPSYATNILDEIEDMDIHNLTPMMALMKLEELKNQLPKQ